MNGRRTVGSARARSDEPKLTALLGGQVVGHVYQGPTGRFRFVYEERWREDADAYPLSLSLPLAAAEHGHGPVNAFLRGLLPDNDRTLRQWGRLYSVSANNPVALLAQVGVDCAGAVQLVPPDHVAPLLGLAHAPAQVAWMSEADVAAELRAVRSFARSGASPRRPGQFSLAGAQPKLALFEEGGRWGTPIGRTPTNRILKPPAPDFDAFAENEHLCVALADALGLAAAHTQVQRFAGVDGVEVAIVVDRFDRRKIGNTYMRIHQEDCCQALGVAPDDKYENQGGPGIRAIFNLIRRASDQPDLDAARFLDAVVLNWVIAGPDAHGKNYALLHAPGRRVRLAPFYDIASYLPYDPQLRRVKFAMKVGGEYLVRRIGPQHWRDLGEDIGVDSDVLVNRIRDLAARVPDAVRDVGVRAEAAGLARAATKPVVERIIARAIVCRDMVG